MPDARKFASCAVVTRANGEEELVVAGGDGPNAATAQTMIFNFLANVWRVSSSFHPDVRTMIKIVSNQARDTQFLKA